MIEISQTDSLCSECHHIVPARIIDEDNRIIIRKVCKKHGMQETVISSNPEWYYRYMRFFSDYEKPFLKNASHNKKCPFNCGFCEEHSQKLFLPVVPITSACNLNCPVCYTINKNQSPYFMKKEEFGKILDQLRTDHPYMQIINFTGGEPLVHPSFTDFVKMCRDAGIGRITVSTNGLRFLEDESLLPRLTELGTRIVFSFNSFNLTPYQIMSGLDLLEKKLKILNLLEKYKPSTTLLTVAASGINDNEIGDIVRYTLESDYIVSSEIHTVAFTGQSIDNFDRKARLTTPDVITKITEKISSILMNDFLPSPCAHPLCYSICYLLKLSDSTIVPFTHFMKEEDIRGILSESLYMDPTLKNEEIFTDSLNDLWGKEQQNEKDKLILTELRQLLDRMFSKQNTDLASRQRLAEKNIKAIYIHSHMDADNFDVERVKRCCVAVPDGKGRNIPTCSYNTIYRALDTNFVCSNDRNINVSGA